MITKNTYYIKRNDAFIWLAPDVQPLETDEVIEVRPMLFADEGKTLYKDDVEVGQCVWLKDGDSQDNYTEVNVPEPEEEEIIPEDKLEAME